MEMYTGAEHRATETHMVSGTTSNSYPTFLPQLEEIGYMSTEMAPEFVVDQGIYYPAANYYGYYSSGFESSGEWDDPNRFLGLDGQDIHYSGLQTESLPYAYYTSDYGYAQSPYNPYNPYIPGAVIGYDAPYIGTQPYFSSPSYQPPAYIPVVVQPGSDAVANNNMDPSLFGSSASMASAHVNAGRKYTAPLASNFTAANSQRSASGNLTSEKSQSSHTSAKSPEGSLINPPQNRQSSSYGSISLGSAAQVPQVRNLPGSAQGTLQLSQRVPSFQNPLKVATPSNDGFSHFGSNTRGWSTADRFRSRFQYDGVANNPNGGSDVLGEQNRGPRTSRSKGQWTPVIADGGYASKVATGGIQRSMLIDVDLYNRGDFPVNYSNARFFVIKSYSEDDVHKSIKYNVWSSTPNGNKKLDNAYADAQRISVGKPRSCPIFLFFSVNASGQFCGVSEMTGPVDFHKDMDFWQQDKWTGSFPVKWHIIKDVPNTSFRHIILENNENKPVTNSRDTQEILYLPGMNMLNIFKSSIMKTSILDDFPFYEDREKFMQEEKCRLLGRSYDSCKFLAAFVPDIKTDTPFIQPPEAVEEQSSRNPKEPSSYGASNQPLNADPKPSKANDTVEQPPKSNGYNDKTPEDGKPSNGTVNQAPNTKTRDPQRIGDHHPVAGRKDPKGTNGQHPRSDNNLGKPKDPKNTVTRKPKDTGDEHPITERNDEPIAVRKDSKSRGDEHLVADKNQGKPKDLKADLPGDPKEGELSDTVTVGSMLIRVNGASSSSSSGVITVGSIPIESKSSKHKGTLAASRLLQK